MWLIKQYYSGFYDVLKYHRNAWINSAYLAFVSLLEPNEQYQFINPAYDLEKVKYDVNDQMFRFYRWANPEGMALTQSQWGIRNYNLVQRPSSTRSTSTNPLIAAKEIDPSYQRWREWLETPFGVLYEPIVGQLFNFEDHYLYPITASEAHAGAMIWGSNPFFGEGGDIGGNGLREERGNSFMLPYYIGRYYGFIEEPTW